MPYSPKIFVPLGIDCTIARYLRDKGLRKKAYPFDWTGTYEGIHEAVSEGFEKMFDLIPDREEFLFSKSVLLYIYFNCSFLGFIK